MVRIRTIALFGALFAATAGCGDSPLDEAVTTTAVAAPTNPSGSPKPIRIPREANDVLAQARLDVILFTTIRDMLAAHGGESEALKGRREALTTRLGHFQAAVAGQGVDQAIDYWSLFLHARISDNPVGDWGTDILKRLKQKTAIQSVQTPYDAYFKAADNTTWLAVLLAEVAARVDTRIAQGGEGEYFSRLASSHEKFKTMGAEKVSQLNQAAKDVIDAQEECQRLRDSWYGRLYDSRSIYQAYGVGFTAGFDTAKGSLLVGRPWSKYVLDVLWNLDHPEDRGSTEPAVL